MNRKISNESLVAFLFVDRALRCVWCITIWIITNPPIPGKPLKAHRPLIPAYSFTQKWWRGTIEAEGPRCAFFLLVRSASRCIRRGGRFLCYRGLFCFGAGPRPGHRQIISDVALIFWFNFPKKIVSSKMKEKCLFPVWKQRLRDTQIFRRITNNRFMQVSCKVFTALRHESRGTEEN